MVRDVPILASILIFFTLSSSFTTIAVAVRSQDFATNLDMNVYGLKKEKFSHFRFYWHDIYSGPNPSAAVIVKSPTNDISGFGLISMIDDPLTEKPQLSSKLIGRAQGFYGAASQEHVGALLMVMNFVFLEGKYNGSTLSILGRNKVLSDVREMPVIGGSGLFRFAKGYVQATTYSFNQTSGDAVVEYNVYVFHY
ncbi:hypothetical protein JCGZ_19203 [Jatropha curcas]|uniref:Dirigent protein n=2 Tax=Jatropha curcas TaxID=180498 RepID=A0A067L7B0_JATCU|nr:hypothetical protein JCGZ_19203 [Jatropha curcas]